MKSLLVRIVVIVGCLPVMLLGQQAESSTSSAAPLKLAGPSLTAAPAGAVAWVRQQWIDSDGNGWNDVWELIYPEINTADTEADTDGDGLTDYQEMLLGRDPVVPAPPPGPSATPAQRQEAMEALRLAWAAQAPHWAEVRARFAKIRGMPIWHDGNGDPLDVEEHFHRATERHAALEKKLRDKTQADLARGRALLLAAGRAEREISARHGGSIVFAGMEGNQPVFVTSFNAGAAHTVGTDQLLLPLGSGPFGLSGAGVNVGLWDVGDPEVTASATGTHQEFFAQGTSTLRYFDMDGTTIGQTANDRLHATHVAGTLAAAGVQSAARGMAPGAMVRAYTQGQAISTMTQNQNPSLRASPDHITTSNHSYGPIGGWTGATMQITVSVNNQQQQRTAAIWQGAYNSTSNSEDTVFGSYDGIASAVDALCYDAQTYLPVWAAGNDRGETRPLNSDGTYWVWRHVVSGALADTIINGTMPAADGGAFGYDTIASFATAKNILTVGSCAKIPGGYVDSSSVLVAPYSAFGPCDDGRIKPDLVAPGEGIYSSAYSATLTNQYATQSGTSMAAPVVTGSLALLVQQFRAYHTVLFPPNTVTDLWASTMKALLIHTAYNASGQDGPDYRAGWGMLNTLGAASLMSADYESHNLAHIKQTYVPNGGNVSFTVRASGDEPLKVTICWTDPAMTASSSESEDTSAKLTNDLELRVTDVLTGEQYYPFTLDRTQPAEGSVRGENHADNVEQVFISHLDEAKPITCRAYQIDIFPRVLVNNQFDTLIDANGNPAPQAVSIIISGNVATGNLAINNEIPTVTSSYAGPTVNGRHLYQLQAHPVIVGGVYQLQESTDLIHWTNVQVPSVPGQTTLAFQVEVDPTDTQRFWRYSIDPCATPP